jgi:glycosyltransferase involved in cell wall biosynthesis
MGITWFHVPDGDPDALSHKLAILISNPELRQKMGERAARYAQDYAWEKIAPQIEAVYQNLLT